MKYLFKNILIPFVLICSIFFIITNRFPDKKIVYESFLKNEYKKIPSFTDDDLREIPKPTHPDLAAIQNYFMTIDPQEKRVPIERLKAALKTTKSIQKLKQYKSVISDISWKSIPSNIAGRTRCIMFDPNDANHKKVWAGTATGGLWYNDDITETASAWQNVDDFWSSLAISSMAYDPNNTQIFYVGTGEAQTALTIYRESSGVGGGIWKTSDGGISWNLLTSTEKFKYVTEVKVKDENGVSVIYAGVVSGFYKGSSHQSDPSDGLYRSVDNGNTWEQVLPNIANSDQPYAPSDIEISASGRIFVGTMRNLEDKGGATILYSDAGTKGSWTVSTSYINTIESDTLENIPGRVILACAPSDSNRVYALIGAAYIGEFDGLKRSKGKYILKSENAGLNWSETSLPTTQDYYWATIAWHALAAIVHPEDEDVVFVAGLDCYKSKNAGTNWTKISDWLGENYQYIHADIHNFAFNPANYDQLLVCTDGGVFYSSNSQSTIPIFSDRNSNFNCLQFYTCAIDPRAGVTRYLGGLQDNGTVLYTGDTINKNDVVSGGDGSFCFIDQTDIEYWTTSTYNNYYVFFNGDNFTENTTYYNTGIFINPADFDSHKNILYANATTFKNENKNKIIRYKNVPTTISSSMITITSDVNVPFSHIKVSPYTTNSSTLFVGTQSGRLFKVKKADGTPVSSEIGGDEFPLGNISCVAVGGSEDSLLVCFSNYGVSSIWQTYNGGDSWEEKEGNLPDMPIRWAVYDPYSAKKALLATEIGVWYTDELDQLNPEWIPVNEGLANVRVDMLKIRESDHTILAATHGRGFAISIDPSNFNEQETDKLIIAPNPSNGIFKILYNGSQSANAEVKIFDLIGRQVYIEDLGEIYGNLIKEIDLSNLPKGTYILHFLYGNEVFTKKIIIN